MLKFRIEQAAVGGVAFLLGAGVAMCIVPGDRLLWVIAGVLLGLFCREHFIRDWAGDFFGWIPHHHDRTKPNAVGRP